MNDEMTDLVVAIALALIFTVGAYLIDGLGGAMVALPSYLLALRFVNKG